jgi:hypothetical protein
MGSVIRVFAGRHFTAICLIALGAGFFVYESVTETFRLGTVMPAQFAPVSNSAGRSIEEERIARAYWDCAVIRIQGKYLHDQALPEEPIKEFVISPAEFGAAAQDPALRLRYWRKLKTTWNSPSVWRRNYEWDLRWLSTWADTSQGWLNNRLP